MPGLLFMAVVPHPPLIIPAVGGEEAGTVKKTAAAMQAIACKIATLKPDTVVVISPHGPVFRDAVAVFDGKRLSGDLGRFNAPAEDVEVEIDTSFVAAFTAKSETEGTVVRMDRETARLYQTEYRLDHGALIPMLFLKDAGVKAMYVNITYGLYSYDRLYRLGFMLRQAAEETGRKIVVIASGDLSHCLIPGAPAGYRPEGPVFDRKLKEMLAAGNVEGLLNFQERDLEKAAECGFRSIIMAFGALDGLQFQARVLSYEGPFGVGYLVAEFEPSGEEAPSFMQTADDIEAKASKEKSFPAALARRSLETYLKDKRPPAVPADTPLEFQTAAAGVFVSLYKEGSLRGCIGTIEPATSSIAAEIIQNAVSAGLYDSRFPPVKLRELPDITFSVDVLMPPEPAAGLEDLNPQEYGVVVALNNRRGLLLPDLPGVDTPREQVEIACRKAGISPQDNPKLYRFRVKRYD